MTATPSTTKTDNEADARATAAEEPVAAAGTAADPAAEAPDDIAEAEAEGADEDELDDDVPPAAPVRTGIGAGAAAVVSGALGLASLTGTWTGKVLSERETLLGQIKTAQGGSASAQIHEIYGDSWHTTAAVNGTFALLALLVGAFVLARPAFGAPDAQPQPGWVRAVALGGVVLGAIGLLLSVGMYFDLFATLPSTGS
ncbi:hypothetical protein A8W25_21650 [Streptomyces sp. ERV7]|uniref:hypothetical protein n=1 Tax=Streptomyces sp. ERV7 TaxID=1322334 RepID=UPI0007F3588D|nr:hypothetical protein [Streptomyces sp. ERV7]OAR22279.1 hypothetical protein A8W25_21650 [Streptomyces sp. ERV7]